MKKVIFFGLGSIGKKHLRLINEMYDFDIYAYRTLANLQKSDAAIQCYTEVFDWDTITRIEPDAAFICNPTFLHIETAIKCVKHRIYNIFLEKPIDCKTNGLRELTNLIADNCATVYVGYPLRHLDVFNNLNIESNTAYICCKSNLADWRDYQTYSAFKSKGGGCILELSHEIYLADYLLGPIVDLRGSYGKAKNSTTDAEDFCHLVAQHENGAYSNIFLDISWESEPERYIIFNDGIDRIDYKADDDLFKKQLGYFFDNLNNPEIDNNLISLSSLFKKLIKLRNLHDWGV